MSFHRVLALSTLLCLLAAPAASQRPAAGPAERSAPSAERPAQQAATDDGFLITADSVEGSEAPDGGRVAHLTGNVTITRGDATLVGRRGVYYERSGLAVVFGDVRGVDGTSTIACDTLRYFRDADRAHLMGNASYGDTSGVTNADLIVVFRRERIAVCTGRAVAADHDGSFELAAGRILYDFDREEARASGAPRLRMFGDEGEEDGVLTAELIEFSPENDSVMALGDAVITTGEVTARARVAVLTGDGDTIELSGDPVVDQEGDLLTGRHIRVSLADNKVERVRSTGDASATYTIEPDDPGEHPQSGHVDGDTLTMYLHEGEPKLTTVRGHALSEHVVGETGERNAVDSREIDVLFVEGRIRRVVFRGNASGTYTFAPEEPGEVSGEEAGASSPDTLAAGGEPAGAAGSPAAAGEPAAAAGSPAAAAAQADTVELESVAYQASRIDYYVARNRIILSQGARIRYKQTLLDADEVVYDPDDQIMTATGSPDLREADDRMAGSTLLYDLDRQAGVIADGVTTFEDGLYTGSTIAREPDGALLVGGGVYTTCADSEPHYRLTSNEMKVYLNDKVVARPLILYVGEIPVFALPFYVFPIRKERHSGFLIPQVELGFSEGKGRFIRNFGYYWAPSDYFDVTLWGDYYEQTKWIGHVEGRYKKRYTLSGSVSSSFTEELLNNRRRWDLKFNHRQEMGRYWTAGASGDFRSDAAYAQDTNQTIEESVNRSLHSQAWVRGRWSSVSAGVTLDRREQLDEGTVSELLPKIDVTASQRPLIEAGPDARWWESALSKVSYGWDAKAVNDRDRDGDDLTVRQAAGVGLSVRGTGRLLGWLSLSPRLNARQNWYDRDKEGRRYASRLTYDGSVSARTTVYGTFFPRLGPLTAVRHIIEPTASLSYTPEFARYFDDDGVDLFYTLSGFGSTPRKRKAMNLSLVNKLQVKLGEGDGERRIDNLVRLSNSTSYNYEAEGHKWADVSSKLEIRPTRAVSLRWNARHDTEDWDLESTSMTVSLSLTGSEPLIREESWEERTASLGRSPVDELREELATMSDLVRAGRRPWDAGLTFRYSRGADPDNSTYWLDGDLALSLTPNWRVNYKLHYDVKDQEIASQEYTIYRDLHCWEAQFTRRYYDDEWQYYFRVSVKALPEIQAESGQKHLQRGIR